MLLGRRGFRSPFIVRPGGDERDILACLPAKFEVNDDGREFVQRAKDLVAQVNERERESNIQRCFGIPYHVHSN